MKKINNIKIFIILFLGIPSMSFAATYTSVVSGDWNVPGTWGQAILTPVSGDNVIIDGHQIQLSSGTININNLTLTNASGNGFAQLQVTNFGILNVLGNMTVTAENVAQDVEFMLKSWGEVHISGDLYIERVATNNRTNLLQLAITGNSQLTVSNSFDYSYKSAGAEASLEIQMNGNASFTVGGESTIGLESGESFTFTMSGNSTTNFQDNLSLDLSGGKSMDANFRNNANLTIDKSLSLTNSGGSNGLSFNIETGGSVTVEDSLSIISTGTGLGNTLNLADEFSYLDLNGHMIMDAPADGLVSFDISNLATANVAGDVVRSSVNGYGSLTMDATTTITFDGAQAQTIPQSIKPTAGTDSFDFTNININNTSAEGVTLEGDLTLTKHFALTDGIITTKNVALLIIDDGATIDPGSSTAYIDGPMVKRGSTNGVAFTFPVGSEGKFAPIGIEAISNAALEYTAEFTGCPPPIGTINAPLQHVIPYGYWSLERNDGNAVGDITLHWDDAEANGIDHLSSLVTSRFDLATGWHTMGSDNVTGGIGPGVSGSMTNDTGCPPPIGASIFTFGSTNKTKNILLPLPVDLLNFRAYKSDDNLKVFIEWQTASETNSDYFIVEKSNNGVSFKEIVRPKAARNSSTVQNYNAVDSNPNSGNNYYRIRQVDQDQAMAFSDVVNVFIKVHVEEMPIIFPNPVKDQLTLQSDSFDENDDILVLIFDINGKRIYTHRHKAEAGRLVLPAVNLNLHNPGPYFLTYKHNGQGYSLEFFKAAD